LPADYEATVVIAQHMDDQYIPSFIKRLDSVCKLSVEPLREDEAVFSNRVYICSSICELRKKGYQIVGSSSCKTCDYNPSVNKFFHSVAEIMQECKVLSIILTGIGADGALGMQEIVSKGGRALVEDFESSVVYGMPLRAKELNPQAKECSLDAIIENILEFDK